VGGRFLPGQKKPVPKMEISMYLCFGGVYNIDSIRSPFGVDLAGYNDKSIAAGYGATFPVFCTVIYRQRGLSPEEKNDQRRIVKT